MKKNPLLKLLAASALMLMASCERTNVEPNSDSTFKTSKSSDSGYAGDPDGLYVFDSDKGYIVYDPDNNQTLPYPYHGQFVELAWAQDNLISKPDWPLAHTATVMLYQANNPRSGIYYYSATLNPLGYRLPNGNYRQSVNIDLNSNASGQRPPSDKYTVVVIADNYNNSQTSLTSGDRLSGQPFSTCSGFITID